MLSSQILLLGAVGLFGVYVLVRLRLRAGRRPRLGPAVAEARERARRAASADERGGALCDAGVAAAEGRRWTAALGYFLRAMRSAPCRAEIIDRAAKALAPRPDLAESMLWRRVAALPDDADHRAALVAAFRALASMYEGPLADRGRARALRRLVELEARGAARGATSAGDA